MPDRDTPGTTPARAATGWSAAPACPTPLAAHRTIQMAHGGGGRRMRELLERVILPAFASPQLAERHDSAVLEAGGGARLAFTTDSYVVSPLFFPGGDIGRLAVFGTANDLAMAGAVPRWLSLGFILEEGLPLETLERVVQSVRAAAHQAGVEIVTGDTKVVDRGKGDGLYVNTAGIGLVPAGVDLAPRRVRPGDAILLSGDLGRHGVAILSVREGLRFETTLESDCAPLAPLTAALVASGAELHCLRDLTRGGLAAALHEIATDAAVGMRLDESAIPVSDPVRAACELLGLDPIHVANEGRLVAFVPEPDAARALQRLRSVPVGRGAVRIGTVTREPAGSVVLEGALGGDRILDLPAGEQLPRIC